MSKSARNYTDPMEVMNTYGADALRLFLMHSAVLKAEDLRYSDTGVREVLKNVIIPLWNSYSFFVTYATIDGASPTGAPAAPANPLDRWILSESARLVEEATRQMDAYDLQKAIDPIVEFIDLTNNWYIRRSRRRFWRSENDSDKAQAYQTLYAVLLTLVKVAAPFIPFITEEIYRNLRTPDMPESVHLCEYPAYEASRRDLALEREMGLARRAVSMGRALRTLHNLKIRQPLKALHLVTRDPAEKAVLAAMRDLIREEMNVKEVVVRENEEELVEYSAKANFKALGKQLGKDMKEAAARIEALSGHELQTLLAGGTVELRVAGRSFPLTAEGVLVTRTEKEHLKVLNEGSLTVALDPELTPELVREGLVRDLVRGVQNLRKERGLAVTDRIRLELHGSEELRAAVTAFQERLTGETLADGWAWRRNPEAAEVECGQETAYVHLRKS
jgi:isoleucyl-tRNA synthetase